MVIAAGHLKGCHAVGRLAGMKSILVAAFLVSTLSPCLADFALKDGDTVVFLGDSITAARRYDRIIENYTLLRYPQRKVKFFNAGKGGDTMTGALDRLQREVFDRGATVLTVAFGVNDIGWGMKADAEHACRALPGASRPCLHLLACHHQ